MTTSQQAARSLRVPLTVRRDVLAGLGDGFVQAAVWHLYLFTPTLLNHDLRSRIGAAVREDHDARAKAQEGADAGKARP